MSEQSKSVMVRMATNYGMEPKRFEQTLMATIIPGGKASPEQVAAFLIVADKYGLDPFTRSIYAFPGKGGGIVPIVGIDGWATIINAHPQYDGCEFEEIRADGKLTAMSCTIYRKDRKQPTKVIEYLAECRRGTEPWKTHESRMLRHKALIQAARLAFGFAGIYDPDEGERIREAEAREVVVRKSTETLDALTARLEEQSAKVENGPATVVVEMRPIEPQAPGEPPEVSFADLGEKAAQEDGPWA